MIRYEDFLAAVRERKRSRWVQILASEPPGRPPGRRPRDPAKEAILTRFDRARLEQARLERARLEGANPDHNEANAAKPGTGG